jgi:hypothetical protein
VFDRGLVGRKKQEEMSVEIASRACFIIGLIGFFTYSLIFFLSFSCYLYAINRYTRRIFLLLSFSVLFQLPWYSNFILYREDTGKVIYSLHMIASIFYFGSYSFVCFAWGDVLRAKNFELFFEYKFRERIRFILILANILFICLTFIMVYYCLTSASLRSFFQSKPHYIFAGFDVIKNLIMGIFIAHFGHNLRARLMNYYKNILVKRNQTTTTMTHHSQSTSSGGESASTLEVNTRRHQNMTRIAENTANLIRVNQKLVVLVCISIFAFLLKALALIMWRRYTSPSEYEPPAPLEHRWVFWWVVFEIFPVALPAIGFIFTMGWPSKMLSSQVISFPENLSTTRTSIVAGGGVGDLESDRERSSEYDDGPSHARTQQQHHVEGNGVQIIQTNMMTTTTTTTTSPLSGRLLDDQMMHRNSGRYSYGYEGGPGDDDCFHVMNRLSALSGDLIDIELDRDSMTAPTGESEGRGGQARQETLSQSSTASTSRFQFRFPSITSSKN